MSDVFISYAQGDRSWVAELATALEAQGHAVWWDPNLLPGTHYRDAIRDELLRAKAVLVVWPRLSVESDWVRDEAEEGRTRRKLIPVLKDPIEPPHGFRQIQTSDLSQWRGRPEHPQFQMLLRGIDRLTGQAPGATPAALKTSPQTQPIAAAPRRPWIAWLSGALGIVVIVAAVWFLTGRTHDTSRPGPMAQIPAPPAAPDPSGVSAAAQSGAQAYSRKDYARALQILRPYATSGSEKDRIVAQFFVGLMTAKGWGTPSDGAAGSKLMQAAAESGLADAQNYMAAWYRRGEYVPRDDAQSVSWSLRAAEQGYQNAQYRLALAYRDGIGATRNTNTAYRWAVIAASNGEKRAVLLKASLAKDVSEPMAGQIRREAAAWLATKHTLHPMNIYSLVHLSPDN